MKKLTLFLMLAAMCMPQFMNAKVDPPLEFTTDMIEVYVGYTLDASQFLDNPANLPVTWHSDNESVFTVDENGVVTGITPNMVSGWLTVSFEGNDEYWNTIAGMEPGVYVWVKNEYPLSIGDYAVTPEEASDFWGGNMSFDPVTNTLTMKDVVLNDRDIKWNHESPLTINLVGENKVVNGSLEAQKLILTGGGSIEQNYVLYADSLVIDNASLRVEVAFPTGGGMDYTFSINKLSIINSGHFYACISAQEGSILGEYDHVGFVNEELNFGEGIDYIISYLPIEWVPDVSAVNVIDVWNKDMFNHAFFWVFDETYLLLRGALEIGYVDAVVETLPDDEPTEITFDNMEDNAGKVVVSLGANDEITEGPNGNVSLKTPVTITDEEIDDLLENHSPSEAIFRDQLPGITIKLPAGKGDIVFDVTIDEGWSLTLKEPGNDLFFWDQEEPRTNWGTSYDNTDETLAHFFVRSKEGVSAPARRAKMEEWMTGVTIYSIKVIPEEQSGPTAIENTMVNGQCENAKMIINGQLLIERDGKLFTLTGAQVR